jgi:hypothetical protein
MGLKFVRQRERHPVHRRLGDVVEEGDPVVGGVVVVSTVGDLDHQSARRPDQQRDREVAGDGMGVHRQTKRAQPIVQ